MDISLKCSCGALRGVVHDISSRFGHRTVCMCDDCQAYAHYLGQAKTVLDDNGGTEVVPVAPAHIEITQGIENLKSLQARAILHKEFYRIDQNELNTAPLRIVS